MHNLRRDSVREKLNGVEAWRLFRFDSAQRAMFEGMNSTSQDFAPDTLDQSGRFLNQFRRYAQFLHRGAQMLHDGFEM